MIYRPNRFAVLRYLFERFEQALGLGALLAIVANTGWLPISVAVVAFILILALAAAPVARAIRRIRQQQVEIDNGDLVISYGEDDITRYPLTDFHIVLYKSRKNKVYEFKLYTDNETLKLRHFDQLHELFIEICRVVETRKKARWWQFL